MIRCLLSWVLTLMVSSIYAQHVIDRYGAIIRSDTSKKEIYLCFTGHEYAEGFKYVIGVLQKHKISASFFLTGDFIRNQPDLVQAIKKHGHIVGAHSDKHLLYCDWSNRDSLLQDLNTIEQDIEKNLKALETIGITPQYFMPPYEWYNKKVVEIASELNQITVNFTPGTKSNADYTTPEMSNYISSQEVLNSIFKYEEEYGMNGFQLLIHPGTGPLRTDKFYLHLEYLIQVLKKRGYDFSKFGS